MADAPRRGLEVTNAGDVTVVTFTDDELTDAELIRDIGTELSGLVGVDRKKILLDFANVRFLASLALGMLITLHRRVSEVGGRLAIRNLDPLICDLFRITGLNTGGDDPDAEFGGVVSRPKRPHPSGGNSAALRLPPPPGESS